MCVYWQMRTAVLVVCALVAVASVSCVGVAGAGVSAQMAKDQAAGSVQWDWPWKKKAAAGKTAPAAPAQTKPAAQPTTPAPAQPKPAQPAKAKAPAAGGKTCGGGGQCYKKAFCDAYGGKVVAGTCTGARGKPASGMVCCQGATKTAQSHAKEGMAKLGGACEFRGLNGKCIPPTEHCPGSKAKSNCAGAMTCCTNHQQSALDKNIQSGQVKKNWDSMAKISAADQAAERQWRRTHPNGF